MRGINNKESEFQKDARSHLRAMRLLLTYSPEWSVMGITLVMDGVYPFISIYVSAMLLDALYGILGASGSRGCTVGEHAAASDGKV